MPNPTAATTIQRPDLGALAYEYMLDASQRGFIGFNVMPVFPVSEQSADYPVIPIESMLKVPSTKRAKRGAYPRGDWEFETNTYSCEEYGWEEPVDDVEAALYQRFFDAEEVSTEIAVDHILRDHEKRVAAIIQDTSLAGGSATVTNEWDDSANCTPKADVKTAITAMRVASGLIPNAGIMSKAVFDNVMISNEIKTYLQYTSPHLVEGAEAQRRMLANYFGLAEILIGGGQEDTAIKGQTFSLADIWDDEYFTLARISAGGNALKEPVVGRTFLWTADSPQTAMVESYREEQTRSDIIRVRENVDEAIIFSGAMYILDNITS